jgi:hypothetical protein
MSWKKKGNVYGVHVLGSRHHKAKTYTPVLKNVRTKERIHRYLSSTKLANKRYYRIYRHKGQGYTLYVGPPKESHGGIRTRPSAKRLLTKERKQWEKESGLGPVKPKSPLKPPTKREIESGQASPGYKEIKKLPTKEVFKVRKVKWGQHKGEYITQKGKYLAPDRLHLFIAKNKRYKVIVKE